LTACRMRSAYPLRSSRTSGPYATSAIRSRLRLPGTTRLALRASMAGSVRGPVTADGGTLALEIKLPPTADDEPELVKAHVLPALDSANIPKGATKTLRAISMVPDEAGHFYVLLGPKGYEKEELVLARWDLKTGKLTKATVLPKNFVAEGVTPIPGGKVLVVDDLKEAILVATEK